jgi:hypothetical protein
MELVINLVVSWSGLKADKLTVVCGVHSIIEVIIEHTFEHFEIGLDGYADDEWFLLLCYIKFDCYVFLLLEVWICCERFGGLIIFGMRRIIYDFSIHS